MPARSVLEQHLGMRVSLEKTDASAAFAAVAQGNADIFIGAHLLELHREYYQKNQGRLKIFGSFYRGAQAGLVVPSYVEINKISDLNDYSAEFWGKILCLESDTAVLEAVEQQIIPRYKLAFDVDASSEQQVQAGIRMAIDACESVVMGICGPHWMFAKWDLKYLRQDVDKLIWKPDEIQIIGRKDLEADNPQLAGFLGRFSFTEDELCDLLLKVWESTVTADRAAEQWLGFHDDLLQSWFP
ncbi:MAG: glycine betaine ABC transporter substrate-binding protein [Spirochaetota bacterium]|nr:glycine betaine ABC transporter substrate-binding protein [Spirochaetota bacterium]